MNVTKITIVLTVLIGWMLSGCAMTRWIEVESGEYTVVAGHDRGNEVASQAIQKVAIDRNESTLRITLVDGSEIITSFVSRDRAMWPAGCPSNVGSTRMEVLDIGEASLTIGSESLRNPILVRDCPPDPIRVVLREDWAFDVCCKACPGPQDRCVFLRPEGAPER